MLEYIDKEKLYTCAGKGGTYQVLGNSIGAGDSRNEIRVVYKDVETSNLYHREIDNFLERMEVLE